MTGDLPVNNGKKWGFIAVLFIILLLLLHLFLKSWAVDVILSAIITLIVSAIVLGGMKPVAKRTQAGEYEQGEIQLTRKEERLLGTERSAKPSQTENKPGQTKKPARRPGPAEKKQD